MNSVTIFEKRTSFLCWLAGLQAMIFARIACCYQGLFLKFLVVIPQALNDSITICLSIFSHACSTQLICNERFGALITPPLDIQIRLCGIIHHTAHEKNL